MAISSNYHDKIEESKQSEDVFTYIITVLCSVIFVMPVAFLTLIIFSFLFISMNIVTCFIPTIIILIKLRKIYKENQSSSNFSYMVQNSGIEIV